MSVSEIMKQTFKLPSNACDSHCHVFGPASIFPYSDIRKYTPQDAPKQDLFALHKQLGFERAVLVQASCHGTDNSAMLDMMQTAEGRYRGVAIIDEDFDFNQLQSFHDAGVRGIRFNFLPRLVDVKPKDYYLKVADKVAKLGWHIVVYFESENLINIENILHDISAPLVIDHMGRPDVNQGLQSENFQRICELVKRRSDNWIKVSCVERLTKIGAPYSDVIPYAKYLVDNFSSQVLWGTDWPHPNMEQNVPNDVLLVNTIPLIASTTELQKKLLVDNPDKLYKFES
jgi:2-pyrone-4,6-dicarboxylate lactonase